MACALRRYGVTDSGIKKQHKLAYAADGFRSLENEELQN
jgi:hypothetical protein